jgi:hypothetical protein
MTTLDRTRLSDAYHAHEEAETFLRTMGSAYQQARGTKHDKLAHAAKCKAKADAKIVRERLAGVAREVLGLGDMLFPDVLVIVRDALGIEAKK